MSYEVFLALVPAALVAWATLSTARTWWLRTRLQGELGADTKVLRAGGAVLAVRRQRGVRVLEARAALGAGAPTWFVTSPRPPTLTPWEATALDDGAATRLTMELERVMLRADVARLETAGGTVTVAVRRRGTTAADILEVLDVAAELVAIVDRERPHELLVTVDEPLVGRATPRGALGADSGTPFGVTLRDDR